MKWLFALLVLIGAAWHFVPRMVEDRLNPEVITNPIYSEIRVEMEYPGRTVEGVMVGEMVDQADCQRNNRLMEQDFTQTCPKCKVRTVECKAELAPRYAKLLNDEPVAMTTYLRLARGARAEREFRLIYWGITEEESGRLCQFASEFQKSRKGAVTCIRPPAA